MNIVISGSRGFIGQHLIKSLSRIVRHKIIELDLALGKDICIWENIKNINNFDLFIHLANKVFVPESFSNPRNFYHANTISTLNALELCRLNKAKFIYLSSYVYGKPKYLPIDEKHIIQSYNPYANSKILCEKLCEGYFQDFEVPVLVLRPFNIFGPGQNSNFLISSIMQQASTGKIFVNDLNPKRDFLYVADFVNLLLKIIEKGFDNYNIYNAGSGISVSVENIIKIVNKIYQNKIHIHCNNKSREYEIMEIVADISKAKKDFDWEANYSLEKALIEYHNNSLID